MAKDKIKARKEVQNKIRELLDLDEDATEVDVLEALVRVITLAEQNVEPVKINDYKWPHTIGDYPWTTPTIEPWTQPAKPYITYNNASGI